MYEVRGDSAQQTTNVSHPVVPDTEVHAQILSHDESRAIFDRIVRLTHGVGDVTVNIDSRWRGNLRWANNDVIGTGDTLDHTVSIVRRIRGAGLSSVTLNQLDDASFQRALDVLEYRLQYMNEDPDAEPLIGPQQYVSPQLDFSSTKDLVAAERSRIGRMLTEPVANAGLLAAGYLAVEAVSRSVFNTNRLEAYAAATYAQYSVTVRNPQGTGSGWAGVDFNDWHRIDAEGITARAKQKCIDSANPRAVEPGRYTAILEPQAVHDLMRFALGLPLLREGAEGVPGPYHLSADQSKLGLRLLDPRVTIWADPMDPDCGFIPFDESGQPYKKTSWFTNGVLTELSYDRRYALTKLAQALPQPNSLAFHMSGGTVTVEEMIASTKRGVLVTRLSGLGMIDGVSLLATGVTRDGLWLIENGKITYPIKNFRFNESPLFVFNQIEQMGVPVRVFSPDAPSVVPPVKVREFNFTGIADAV